MDDGTEVYGGYRNVYRRLIENGRFLIIKRVMRGVEEKRTAKILICFSEWTLRTVQGKRWTDTERDIGRGICCV